ncbi:Sec-independent protein translocase subunit TatA [Streptomyces sp. NBC_01622]|uniref:Sec-independent protein translocase subunit TatA n=1 Tax=Streptomyces sp. NBC_01622 TaxID=2975903 RepID=UPI00386CE7C7|nr:Sec-independent protein translocase subunit TatA [Streptomyces sp. NBC_01622]
MLRNGLEPWHLLVVAIMVILLFGSKKLPEAARGLGKSMRILKSEAKAMKEEGNVAESVPVHPTAVHTSTESLAATNTEPPAPAH